MWDHRERVEQAAGPPKPAAKANTPVRALGQGGQVVIGTSPEQFHKDIAGSGASVLHNPLKPGARIQVHAAWGAMSLSSCSSHGRRGQGILLAPLWDFIPLSLSSTRLHSQHNPALSLTA